MINSTLLEQGTGIELSRREEIVFEAHRYYVDTFPADGLEDYGFKNTSSFDYVVLDFDSRLLPEQHTAETEHHGEAATYLNMEDRYLFLRGVAAAITLKNEELPLCAELLAVRPVVLRQALALKSRSAPIYPRFLIGINGGLAS